MSRGCALWIAAFVIGLFSVVPFALAPTADEAWTQGYVESNWGQVDSGRISDTVSNSFDVGWDPTERFYALLRTDHPAISIIDRFHRQSCSIGWGTIWADGRWVPEAEGTSGYEVVIHNQYGLNISYQLGFSTWQITETTYGYCPMSPNDCHPVDPPLVSTSVCAPSTSG